MTAPVTLHTLLGDYPHTRALKTGAIASPNVSLAFADVAVPNKAFKRVVRNIEFDVAELAIMTFLIARAHGKPLVLIPAVMFSRFQHHYLIYNADRGLVTPASLAGKRVGVRSYTTTTAAWIRGVLADDYAVDLDQIRWMTLEEPHVAEYRDPPTVERAPAGSNLVAMLLDGRIDAAIVDPVPADPRVKTVVPDPPAAAEAWEERHQALQVNHLVVVRESLTRSNPEAVREVYRLLVESKKAAGIAPGPADSTPFGVENNRRNLEVAIDYAHQQRLIPRRFAVDELFDDVTRSLS
jgi:4,5-dihydroxyphthalate decarboxylase